MGRRSSDHLGLFFAVKQGKEWSEVTAFEHNGTGFSTMAPAFSRDGRSLYFASDRPGGHGGMDLYESRRGPDGWSAPKNLGPEVNSTANEAFLHRRERRALLLFGPGRRHGAVGHLHVPFRIR